ncbi:MAG: hypothetical protein ABF975_04355 [Liquorilactobacillus hordei]|uniref:hypothetical protein n=1 Tax=Liquorilactobacillus hordei TaxID=468911 RepID=UPI0039ECFD8B
MCSRFLSKTPQVPNKITFSIPPDINSSNLPIKAGAPKSAAATVNFYAPYE